MDIVGMFTGMFRSSVSRQKTRAQAALRVRTIGRVQAKAMKAQQKAEKKLNRAQDNALNMGGKKNTAPAARQPNKGAATAGKQQQMTGGAAAGNQPRQVAGGAQNNQGMQRKNNAPTGNNVQNRRQNNTPQKTKDNAKMGKGSRNKNQQTMDLACTQCQSVLDPSWDMCPYCGTPVGQMNVGVGAALPNAQGNINPEKTMAINLDELNSHDQKAIVGWLVAQNGPHRGQDFRVYDGKNVIGTAADCDIVITDPYLSAKHCTIRHENGNFQLLDLDSRNGTFLNQAQTRSSHIIDNDTMRIGRTEFKFKSLF